jgi:hypothetical protein
MVNVFQFCPKQQQNITTWRGSFSLNQGERTELYQNKVGHPLVQFFGYKTDGVWLSQAQITEARLRAYQYFE